MYKVTIFKYFCLIYFLDESKYSSLFYEIYSIFEVIAMLQP